MLGKLIKNEFKATARNFAPVYLVMIVVSIFMKIMEEITDNAKGSLGNNKLMEILSILSILMFVIAIMAVIFGTIVLIVKRFYDNMLKDEGYLSFTLPVTTGQHIISKALVSYVWVVASVLIIIVSVIILFLGDGLAFTEIRNNIHNFFELINEAGWWGYFIEVVVMILVSVYANIMLAYTCLSVEQAQSGRSDMCLFYYLYHNTDYWFRIFVRSACIRWHGGRSGYGKYPVIDGLLSGI